MTDYVNLIATITIITIILLICATTVHKIKAIKIQIIIARIMTTIN